METSKLYLSRDKFLLEKKRAIVSTFASRLMHVLSLFQQKKILLMRQFLAWLCAVPSTPFCTTATINNSCLQCLASSVAETAGACNAARPQCLVPFLAKTAGACCGTQLACDVLCPRWPRPLGLAVHTVSSPAISKPLWRHRHSACCEKISSLPMV
jgi:hypothetical protein